MGSGGGDQLSVVFEAPEATSHLHLSCISCVQKICFVETLGDWDGKHTEAVTPVKILDTV